MEKQPSAKILSLVRARADVTFQCKAMSPSTSGLRSFPASTFSMYTSVKATSVLKLDTPLGKVANTVEPWLLTKIIEALMFIPFASLADWPAPVPQTSDKAVHTSLQYLPGRAFKCVKHFHFHATKGGAFILRVGDSENVLHASSFIEALRLAGSQVDGSSFRVTYQTEEGIEFNGVFDSSTSDVKR